MILDCFEAVNKEFPISAPALADRAHGERLRVERCGA